MCLSVVPYFFGSATLASLPFSRAARLLHAARTEPQGTFSKICSDGTTLARTNLRYAEVDQTPRYSVPAMSTDPEAASLIDGTEGWVRDCWASSATAAAKQEAAARLAAKSDAIARFAVRCSGTSGAGDAAVVCDALVAVVELLVSGRPAAEMTIGELRKGHTTADLAAVGRALEVLSLNVGVPRDLGLEAARALRSHLRIVAAELVE